MGEHTDCPHTIPLARCELVDLLCADLAASEAERDSFRTIAELMTASFHLSYQHRLLELKASYAPFDPDADTAPAVPLLAAKKQERLNHLFSDFAWLLDQAHFKHLSRSEIDPVLSSASDWGIRMNVDFSAFEHLAIFARGDAYQKRMRRRWQTFYQEEEVDVPIFRRLVLIMKLRQHPRLGEKVATDHVYLKVFKDIPKLDVMMLLPGARVTLSGLDRGKIGFGLLSGIGTMIYQLFADLLKFLDTLFLPDKVLWALAAGAVGYGYKTYYGYQQTKQAYHLTLTQSLYFQNLDSNAGVLTRLFDEAEEQDSCTAILAYYCLWRYGGQTGSTSEDLDTAMDLYLDRYAAVPFVCEKGEGLERLKKLRLVEPQGERFRALSPERAIEVLQTTWDEQFPGRPARVS